MLPPACIIAGLHTVNLAPGSCSRRFVSSPGLGPPRPGWKCSGDISFCFGCVSVPRADGHSGAPHVEPHAGANTIAVTSWSARRPFICIHTTFEQKKWLCLAEIKEGRFIHRQQCNKSPRSTITNQPNSIFQFSLLV